MSTINSIGDPLPVSFVEYRAIPGHPGYRSGSDGSIWSCRNRHGCLTDQWHRLKPRARGNRRSPTRGRYLSVQLAHRGSHFMVHRLILLAFVGPCPSGMEACHKDNDPANNAISNLRWDTTLANRQDSMAAPGWPRGESKAGVKLTEADVVAIHLMHRDGWKKDVLARRFRVSPGTVRNILKGLKWAHIYRALVEEGRLP